MNISNLNSTMNSLNLNSISVPSSGNSSSNNSGTSTPASGSVNDEGINNRSVYLGGVDPNASAEEILNQVHSGLVDSIKILPEKGCAFISFVDPLSAQMFFRETTLGKLVIRDREVKVGWGKPKPLPQEVLHAVEGGATRNVFIGGIDDSMNEAFFRKEFERFGEVEHVRVIPEKKVAFVHFTSLNSALKCVSTIQKEPSFIRCKVNYGKDRCNKHGIIPSSAAQAQAAAVLATSVALSQAQAQMQNHPLTPHHPQLPSHSHPLPHPHSHPLPHPHHPHMDINMAGGLMGMNSVNSLPLPHSHPNAPAPYPYSDRNSMSQQAALIAAAQSRVSMQSPSPSASGPLPRTVYLGGIDGTTTAEELCEYIKGGLLDNVKVMPEKNCAFVTFVFPEGAQTFFEYASQGLLIKGRQIKVGWGKSSTIPHELLAAVSRGATRNVYIGNILDDSITEQRLKDELGQFGPIESVSIIADKRCAFISFTSISAALKAVEALSNNSRYQNYRINYGKDVCMRIPHNIHHNQNNHNHNHGHNQNHHNLNNTNATSNSNYNYNFNNNNAYNHNQQPNGTYGNNPNQMSGPIIRNNSNYQMPPPSSPYAAYNQQIPNNYGSRGSNNSIHTAGTNQEGIAVTAGGAGGGYSQQLTYPFER